MNDFKQTIKRNILIEQAKVLGCDEDWLVGLLNDPHYQDFGYKEMDVDSAHEYLYWRLNWSNLGHEDLMKVRDLYAKLGGKRK